MNKKTILSLLAVAAAGVAFAGGTEGSQRPRGFRYNGLTLSPYVNLSYTYDSNVDSTKKATADSVFIVNPGLDVEFKDGNGFEIAGNVWYSYSHYCKYSDAMGKNSYGESVALKKQVGENGKKGWTLLIAERYSKVNQSDSFSTEDGRGIWRDRETFNANAMFERRFTDRFHGNVSAAYDYLDYANNSSKYGTLYGWSRWSVGGELGYAFSSWTDALIAASYSQYLDHKYYGGKGGGSKDRSYSVMAGIGSHATEKISYRVLAGLSRFDFADDDKIGWTYQLSGKWQINRRWDVMVLGSSYYQPSESTLGGASKIYALSAGTSYKFTDQIKGTLDLSYRHDQCIYSRSGSGRDQDYMSARIGATYKLNRYAELYARAEYMWVDYEQNSDWNYSRLRGTVGVQLRY